MMTIEAEVIFPKRSIRDDKNYELFLLYVPLFLGLHAVVASDTDFTFATDNTINFNVVSYKRPDNDLRNVKFSIKTNLVHLFYR